MDRFDEIALSKMATILNKQKLINTDSNSKWEKILSNAGQSSLYNNYSNSLNPFYYNGNWKNPNNGFDEFYSAIRSILNTVYKNGENSEEFSILMTSIVEEINIINVLEEGERKRIFDYYDTLDEFYREYTDSKLGELISENANEDFQAFINNLNVLNLDITVIKGKLNLTPFTQQSQHITRNSALLYDWLNNDYPSIAQMYQEAIDNYIGGQPISCISNCRNIITGVFSSFKDDGNRSWVMGLKNLSTDKNIENVTAPNNIVQGSANKGLVFDNEKEFNYPRYKLISQLYSLSCDLGAHSTEAPKINGVLHPEDTTQNDALLCLRMTEDVLIWVKERLKTY